MARRGEKEEAIYEAVFRLLGRGEQANTVTVRQIAQEAGIGKGTVYEYFTSREEILTKAFIRRIEQEAQALAAQIDSVETFDEKLNRLLGFTRAAAEEARLSCIKLMLSDARLAGTIGELCGSINEFCERIVEQLRALMLQMIEDGVREGALSPPSSDAYALMVIVGTVFGYANVRRLLPVQDEDALSRQAKRMIYRAFNSGQGECAENAPIRKDLPAHREGMHNCR